MCLIVHRDLISKRGRGLHLPNAIIDSNEYTNPDGFGIAWRVGDTVAHAKYGPKDYSAFHAQLKAIDANDSVEYVAHFRTATHGAPCQELSHPFSYVDPEVGEVLVFHNGILSIETEKGESDSEVFVRKVLSRLPARWWENDALCYLVEEAIGMSRLLVMTATGTFKFNKKAWKSIDGIHYSTEPYGWSATYGYGRPKTQRYPQSLVPYGSYNHEASWREVDEDKDFPLLPAATESPVRQRGWFHESHWVEALTEGQDSEGDLYGNAACLTCHTAGDYYLLNGKAFIDIAHRADMLFPPSETRQDEQEELDAISGRDPATVIDSLMQPIRLQN